MSRVTDVSAKKERGGEEAAAQIFHDRSRGAAEEMHKLLLSFAAATLAVYFVALTKGECRLTKFQSGCCVAGVLTMGAAVFVGLLGLFADMKRYYFWGSAIQESNHKKRDELYRARDLWLRRQRMSRPVLFVFFFLGIISSIAFLVLRITTP